jgi:hypothetical protein
MGEDWIVYTYLALFAGGRIRGQRHDLGADPMNAIEVAVVVGAILIGVVVMGWII